MSAHPPLPPDTPLYMHQSGAPPGRSTPLCPPLVCGGVWGSIERNYRPGGSIDVGWASLVETQRGVEGGGGGRGGVRPYSAGCLSSVARMQRSPRRRPRMLRRCHVRSADRMVQGATDRSWREWGILGATASYVRGSSASGPGLVQRIGASIVFREPRAVDEILGPIAPQCPLALGSHLW